MKKFLIKISVAIFLVSALIPFLSHAQQETSLTPADCFDYYKFGSVIVDINPEVSNVMAGSQMRFFATTTNNNDYPITDGSLYVKIFQKQTDPQLIQKNGGLLVDQFLAREGISLDANEGRKMDFLWTVPGWLPSGNYSIFTYFQEGKKLNLLGLPFTDDIAGGRADFSVGSHFKKSVWIDKNNVTLNNKPYQFISPPPRFQKDEAVTATLPLKNPTSEKQTVTVSYNLYFWDGATDSQRIDTKEETVVLAAGETKNISYKATDSLYPVYFLVIKSKWHDFSSIADIRFVREGIDRARINFAGVKNFPIKKGEANTLYVCAHNTSPDNGTFSYDPSGKSTQDAVAAGVKGRIELSVVDNLGVETKKYSYSGAIASAITGFKADFTSDQDLDVFKVKASLFDEGNKLVDEVVLKYNCKDINQSKCLQATLPPTGSTSTNPSGSGFDLLYVYIVGGVIVLGVAATIIIRKRKKNIPPMDQGGLGQGANQSTGVTAMMIILFVLLFSFGAVKAEAAVKSATYTYLQRGILGFRHPANGLFNNAMRDPYYSITYKAKATSSAGIVLSDGDSISVGSKVTFSYDPKDLQVTGSDTASWVGTGDVYDTPFGHWKASGVYPYSALTCSLNDFFAWSTNGKYALYLPLSVNPPAITIDTSAAETAGILSGCAAIANGKTCTVASAGNFLASIKFDQTYGYQYANSNAAACNDNLGKLYLNNVATEFKLTVPAQTISFQLKGAVAVVPSLAAPVINGPTSGYANRNYTFTAFSSSTGISNIIYGFDWDRNSIVNPADWTPSASKEIAGTVSHMWAATGTADFQVQAKDPVSGLTSGWGQHGIIIVPAPTSTYLGDPVINGPTSGKINTSYTFTAHSSSSGVGRIKYGFDWNNDGNPVWTLGFPTSTPGSAANPSSTWATSGEKTFKVKAKEDGGTLESGWVDYKIVINSNLIDAPIITGPLFGRVGIRYSFNAISSEVGDSLLKYGFDWGNTGAGTDVPDGIPDAWTSLALQTIPGSSDNLWVTTGTKAFKVKARDEQGNESEWGSFTINIQEDCQTTAYIFWTPCTVSCGPGGTQSQVSLHTDCTTETIGSRTCNNISCGTIIREVPP